MNVRRDMVSKRGRRIARLHLAIGVLLLGLSIGVASAVADGEEADTLPSSTQIADAITSGSQSIPTLEPDSAAAEELPHEDLGRDEALELLEGVFAPQLEAPAGIFSDLDIERFLAPNVAVLAEPAAAAPPGPDGNGGVLAGTVLLNSTVPLRVDTPGGQIEAVDLDLQPAGGELQPVNPLAQVGVPRELGEGIELPGPGVTIRLVDGPEDRATSLSEQSIGFIPNVATDTDLAIAPTPTGVETLTHLRGPDAPHTQTFDLQMPSGATLRATDNGGAAVVDGAEMLVSVSPPVAIDAAGGSVPVSLEVGASTLTLTVTPGSSVAYPILVDPLFQTYEWAKSKHGENGICSSSFEWEATKSCNNREEWGRELIKNPTSTGELYLRDRYWNTMGVVPYETPGLGITASGSLITGDRASMIYTVPRYFTDFATYGERPKSFISGMTLSNLDWTVGSSYNSPYVFTGIWDPVSAAFIKYWSHESLQGHGVHDMNFPYTFANTTNDNGKVAYVSIQATETKSGAYAHLYVGSASIQLSDLVAPSAGPISVPAWSNQTPATATFTAGDSGLGVHSLTATDEAMTPHSWKTQHGCVGVSGAPCPRFWKSSDQGSPKLNFDPSIMPQGSNFLNVVSQDPVGNKSPAALVEVKVDHTKPSLALSGTLTEQAKVGTGLTQYGLKYDAADGDSTTASAQIPYGTPGTGFGQSQRPMGVALDSAGNSYVVDRDCKCVQKYDAAGKLVTQFGAPGTGNGQFSDPRGIAIGGEGVWVADLANKKLQLFSLSGSYIRSIAASSFIEPYAVTTGPENALWVSDIGQHKVFKFTNATGSPKQAFGTKTNVSDPDLSDLVGPVGLAVDGAGNVYVTDNGLNRVTVFNANRQWIGQFGSQGAGNGQFSNPVGIAVAPVTGNVLVADGNNNRVQEFRPNGEYIRQFGTSGPGNNQFAEPRGIALGADRTLYIADAGNKRIAQWTHASYDPQSGVVSTEVKIDGTLVEPKHSPGCATKDCAISKEWVLKADDFSAGQHSLEVTATDGVGLSTSKTLSIETHGDLNPPAVALTGSMTEQATLGTTRPAYTLKVGATDPGSAEERKSGVAATTIKVDGATVDTTSPGCPAGGCSINREWTLNSNSYSVGNHAVQVTATDAAGRVTTKSVTITINRDTTAPEITTTGGFNALFNRPEGWVEQKSYAYWPIATDVNGYGVTSLVLKMDGAVIKSATGTCPNGSCERNILGSLNMANYDGGAHTAEVIATDGAGNTRKRTWTINVDPDGHISVGELTDTLEAVDATSESTLVAPTDETISAQERADGNDPSLIAVAGNLESRGVPTPSAIAVNPNDGFRIVTPDTIVEAEPVAISSIATDVVAAEASAAITANTTPNVDTIVRPVFNGLVTFANIRDATAPEAYSWEVQLEAGQTLVAVDPMDVEIRFASGRRAMLIAAEPAHDAVGTTVETTLSVTGENILTLTVNHKKAGLVYPVVGGTGWEGGFTSEMITGPMDEQEIKEEQERIALEEKEALMQEFEESMEGGEAEPGEVGSPENFDKNDPLSPRIVRFKLSPPEVVNWKTGTKRTKAEGGRCANIGCGTWSTYFYGTFFHNGEKGKDGGAAWIGDTKAKCHTEDAWWIDNDLNGVGWGGPNPAPYGDGKHLTLWCNHTVEYFGAMGPVETRYQLYMHCYGSGYYSATKAYKYPPLILEN